MCQHFFRTHQIFRRRNYREIEISPRRTGTIIIKVGNKIIDLLGVLSNHSF